MEIGENRILFIFNFKTMKLFIKKIMYWGLFITSIYYFIGLFPFLIFDGSFPIYKSHLEFIESNSSAEVLFIGDSRVVSSIDPNKISNSRNLALTGSTPIDSYVLLKKYLKDSTKVETIFMSYSWDRLGNIYFPKLITHRGVPYGLYDYDDYNEVLDKSKLIDKEFSKFIENRYFFMAKAKSPIILGAYMRNFTFRNYANNRLIYESVNKQKGHVTSIWGGDGCDNCIGFESSMNTFKIKPIYDFYIQEIIKLCIAKNIVVIFETIPFNQSSKIDNNVKLEYQGYLKKLSSLYPKTKFNDTIFYYKDIYFEDAHHMKPEGAEKYSEYLNLKYFSNE